MRNDPVAGFKSFQFFIAGVPLHTLNSVENQLRYEGKITITSGVLPRLLYFSPVTGEDPVLETTLDAICYPVRDYSYFNYNLLVREGVRWALVTTKIVTLLMIAFAAYFAVDRQSEAMKQ